MSDANTTREAEFEAERAGPMRLRAAFVVGVSLAIWALQIPFDAQIFVHRDHAWLYRAAEFAVGLGLLAYLASPRTLAALERGVVLTFAGLAVAHGLAISVVAEDCIVPFTLTMEWGQMVIVLATLVRFRAAVVLLGASFVAGTWATAARAHWDVDFVDHAVLFVIYGLLAASVRAYDTLRRAEFTSRVGLADANEALRRSEEARSRLFVNLSHDLRTPLALIRAETEATKADAPESERARSLARIRGNVTALAELTDELLELARLDAGRVPYAPRHLDARALASEVAAPFDRVHARVRLLDADDAAWAVYADPAHLRRILTNLVANAARQVGATGGEVRIAYRADAQFGSIDVEDDGPGVPPARRSEIFERFASFASGGSVSSGIGLPVARELAALGGGDVALVDGAPCTTFRLRLPLGTPPLEVTARERDVAPRLPGDTFDGATLDSVDDSAIGERSGAFSRPAAATLLLVEDHPEMLRLFRELLAPRFHVLDATNVREARDLLETRVPDAVLTDVMLPDGSGYDVLAAVRTSRRLEGVPVVMVSALADDASRTRGMVAGADDYVAKPFSADELVARLEAARKRAEQRRRALEAQREDFVAELHDGVNASLARAALLLGGAQRSFDAEPVRGAREAVREALSEARSMMTLLEQRSTPFEVAMRTLATELESDARPFDVPLTFESSTDGSCRALLAIEEHTVRRLAREAVTNALRHARARTVHCAIRAERGELTLTVEDDGVGLSDRPHGRGLTIASRRAARLGGSASCHARPGAGTAFSARVPLRVVAQADGRSVVAHEPEADARDDRLGAASHG